MPYAESTDLNLSEQRLIELTDNVDAPGEIDETLTALLLVESQAIVDGKLAPVMDVPFADDEVPSLIKVITSWIWAYRIYRHREVMDIPQSIKDDYLMAMQMLADIVAGTLDVGGGDDDAPGSEAATAPVPSVGTSSTRGWTHRGGWCP